MRSLLPAYKDEERRNKDDYYEHNIQAALLYRMRGNVSRGLSKGRGERGEGANVATLPLFAEISRACSSVDPRRAARN
jgi:hypothetical protein